MKMHILRLIFILLFFIPPIANSLTMYDNQNSAQSHCPGDEVVWLNISSGIWHAQGSRWYGVTKHGAFVCKNEAAEAGDRASRT